MGRRGAAPTLQLMVVATLALAAAIFVWTSAAQGCPSSTPQVTSGRFRLPEGSEDGIYVGTVVVDEQGVEQHEVKYLGKGNLTLGSWANVNDDVSRPGGGRKLLQQEGVMCQFGFQMQPADVITAIIMMGNWLGWQGRYWGGQQVSLLFASGCALAYGCNYSGSQQFDTGTQVYRDHNAITASCGGGTGGWYSHVARGSAFGRTVVTASVC